MVNRSFFWCSVFGFYFWWFYCIQHFGYVFSGPGPFWIFKLIHDIDIIELVLGMQFGFGGAAGKRKSAVNLNHVACANLFPHNIIHIEEESQKQKKSAENFLLLSPSSKNKIGLKKFHSLTLLIFGPNTLEALFDMMSYFWSNSRLPDIGGQSWEEKQISKENCHKLANKM